jgi:hypothetical protein
MMSSRQSALLATLLLALARSRAAAQGLDNPRLCWEPKPAPACRRILVTEMSGGTSLESSPVLYLTSEIGFLKTTRSNSAWGVSLFTAMMDDDGRLGLKARYRRWIGKRLVAEAGGGPLLLNATFRARHLGFVAHTSLGYKDWLTATVQMELTRYATTGTKARAFVGLRTGSYPGFGCNLLGAALALIGLSMADPFDHTN